MAAAAAYTGSSLAGLVPVASNDNGPSPPTSLVRFNAIAGHRYHVAVDGKDLRSLPLSTDKLQMRFEHRTTSAQPFFHDRSVEGVAP